MTEYRYKISREVEIEKWNKNLKNSSYANFFQTAEYLYSQNDKTKNPVFLYVEDCDGKIYGQLGLIIQKIPFIYSTKFLNPFAKIITLFGNRGSWAGGPIIHANEKITRGKILDKILEGLKEISQENNLIIIDGYSPPLDNKIDNKYKKQFENKEFSIENYLTYVSDLTRTEEDLWNDVHKSSKRDITKAQKNNIIVKLLDKEHLDEFFELSKIWAKTKGIEKSLKSEIKEKYWNYYQKGTEKVFLAFEDNELISSHRIGCFNGIAYSHSIVNSYLKPGKVGGPFLTWYALQWAKNNQMKSYDYSGGKDPNEFSRNKTLEKQWSSLMTYKKKWGGKEFPYYHFFKINKKYSYKIMRILLKIDWMIREKRKPS